MCGMRAFAYMCVCVRRHDNMPNKYIKVYIIIIHKKMLTVAHTREEAKNTKTKKRRQKQQQ